MNQTCFARRGAVVVCAVTALGLGAERASAGVLLSFTGLNLVYDGVSITDAGAPAGGFGDPAHADPLASLDFFVGGALAQSFSSDISIDILIPDVANIPFTPGAAHNLVTTGDTPGFFDVLIGTSPLASEFLLLRLGAVSVTFLDVAGEAQFLFTGAVAEIDGQNAPLGLEVFEPVTVSISVRIDPGSLTTAAGFVTGFTATGTGEIAGSAIPTPGAWAPLALATAGMLRRRRGR